MSEGYKPSQAEQDKAEDMMDSRKSNMADLTEERESHVRGSQPMMRDRDIQKALGEYDAELMRVEQQKGTFPAEWATDVEKAKAIQSEILQKLTELDSLFKIGNNN